MARKDGTEKPAASKSRVGRDAPDAVTKKGKAVAAAALAGDTAAKLSTKDYERELKKLHVELVKLQEWVSTRG